MKIRNGFVSNSSSSSFCIYGTILTDGEIEDILGEGDTYDKLYNAATKENLDSGGAGPESGEYYIGLSPYNIKDDETGKQFKDRIEASIKTILKNKNNLKFGWQDGAWYDG